MQNDELMNRDDRKKRQELDETRNVLTFLKKDIIENIDEYVDIAFEDEQTKKPLENPDFRIAFPSIGIETTKCNPSGQNKKKGANKTGKMKVFRKFCDEFLKTDYIQSLTKDCKLSFYITPSYEIYRRDFSYEELCSELIERIERLRSQRQTPLDGIQLIRRVKISWALNDNFVGIHHQTSGRFPIEWEAIKKCIDEKDEKYKHYVTKKCWLNIFVPFVENRCVDCIDLGKSTIEDVKERLIASNFERIFVTSEMPNDILVIKDGENFNIPTIDDIYDSFDESSKSET